MSLDEKINESKLLIQKVLGIYNASIVMLSFGKDSMVMLHLIRNINENIPCLYQKEGYFQIKQEFSSKIIQDWNLTVYNYLPYLTVAVESKDKPVMNFVNSLAMGDVNFLTRIFTVEPDYNKPYLCGLFDIITKPKEKMDFKWEKLDR
jgi:3'-phosphoadenosine 5'-phosphosulfate sulfotransferase (PAPS reductase)/FAD synthetase